jgi:hypothetical protein
LPQSFVEAKGCGKKEREGFFGRLVASGWLTLY